MSVSKNYTVYWEDGRTKDFPASSAVIAFIRALSYTLVTKINSDVAIIIDNAAGKIYYAWDWDVSYSEKDLDFNPCSIKRYSEEEVEEMIVSYGKSLGTEISAQDWFEEYKKK